MNARLLILSSGLVLLGTLAMRAERESRQLDPAFLEGLDLSDIGDFDEKQLEAVCKQLQQRLQGEYVLDLAELRNLARTLLPVLKYLPEAEPHAAWLRARLDYLM